MKSYVGMEQHQCPICLEIFDTGNVLLDKRMRASLEEHQLTGLSPCPECQARLDDSFVALIETASPAAGQKTTSIEEARSGNLAWLKKDIFIQVFNQPVPPYSICFIEPGVIDALNAMKQSNQTKH